MVDKVRNLYNNCKNIQKHLSLILFPSYRPFLLPLFLHLCPSSLIILTSHLGFLLLPLHFSAKLLQDMGISLYTFGVSNLICLWSICFISAVLTHNFISSCLVCLVSFSAIFLVCILSLVSNLYECIPFPDLPWYTPGVSALNFCLHKEQSLLQTSSRVNFAIKPVVSK